MRERVKSSLPYILLYSFALLLASLLHLPQIYSDVLMGFLLFMLVGEIVVIITGIPGIRVLFGGLGLGISLYYSPIRYNDVLSPMILGFSMFYVAPRLSQGFAFLLQGIGLSILLYSFSKIFEPLESMFYSAFLLTLLGYILASLEGFGILKGEAIRENVKAFPIAGLLLGTYSLNLSYLGFLGFLLKLFSMVTGLYLLSYLTIAGISKKSEEEAIVGELDIKIEEDFKKDPMLKEAEDAVREFVVKGNKLPLLTYIAFYGVQAGLPKDKLMRLLEPLANYEKRKYSNLAPKWWIKLMEKREAKRREDIVKEISRRIRNE
ncbi:hypothetical protein [Pyrococcus kukulkanii]|uniref:Uncharacterized protein n=1 Tax=Pyrococcus kukulkanii TaxID=1609559 RepID=A0A127BAJ0_9EURY|nr:hypothetical protein [Pyrococcus kukulkanii]AMM53676.1 hypothetical protein TQ32_03670 [Pyrococcus kukulkanii]